MLNLKPHAILDFTQDISHVVTEGGVSGAGVSESVSWLVMLGSFLTYFEQYIAHASPCNFHTIQGKVIQKRPGSAT
jgi:hypothetical protein